MDQTEHRHLATPRGVKELTHQHGFRFKKQLGQNFLVDARVLDAIVEAANVSQQDGVFEIGPGAGVVTARLARQAKRLVAVEKDESLRPVLADALQDIHNVDLVFGDILLQDLNALWTRFDGCEAVSVVANLPYYITTPILFQLFEAHVPVARMVIMVQKEVADRLVAKPGGKDYGALTVAVQFRATVERIVKVGPSSFYPSPDVESTVVRLTFHPPTVDIPDEAFLFRVVRAAFGMRRKTLENALSAGLGRPKEAVRQALEQASIVPSRRGETLSLQEFAELSRTLHAFGG